MQLSPKSPIPTAWTASIPTDTTLYYVRAVLRDTASSATLQSLNLTRESSTPNRYVGTFNPVSDPSGLGRPVDITVSVYEDSAYTTLSVNYQILQTSYVVLQPFIANLGNGGGGSNISYEKIAAVVVEKLKGENTTGMDEMSPEEIDYGRIESGFDGIARSNAERFPALAEEIKAHMTKTSEASRGPIMEELRRAIDGVHARITSLENGALTPQHIEGVKKEVRAAIEGIPASVDAAHKKSESALRRMMENGINGMHGYLNGFLQNNRGDKKFEIGDTYSTYDPERVASDLL